MPPHMSIFGAALKFGTEASVPPHGCGRSSGVEHNLAKVGVEGSNPFARSNKSKDLANYSVVRWWFK
jgi:hypothetical protein